MKYKITQQYVNSSEILFAELDDLNDANLFVNQTLAVKPKSNLKSIYRIFENDRLLSCFNDEKIKTMLAQYADGDCELPQSVSDPFNVIIRSSNSEILLAKFSKLDDAEFFVKIKVLEDSNANHDITYYILDGDKFIDKMNQDTINSAMNKAKQSKHSIRPSPLAFRLRPRGSAYGFYNMDDEEDEDDKNKK